MKLGFVSAILPEQNFEYVVDVACENGFKCIEVASWPKGKSERRYAGVTHIDFDALTQSKAEQINGYLNERGIGISAIGYYPNPLDADADKRDACIRHIKKIINGAPMLGVNTLTTFIGRDPYKSTADNMEEFKKVWPDIIKLAEDKNIRIAIENCPMLFTSDEWPGGKNVATTPKIWTDMFSIIPSDYFGLNYDPSHLLWQQMDYIKPIYDFSEKLFLVHVKDAKVHKDRLNQVGILAAPLDFHTPKLPGLGDINWSKFISALTDVRYNGPLVIEVEDKVFEDTLEDRLKAIEQSKKYISQFVL